MSRPSVLPPSSLPTSSLLFASETPKRTGCHRLGSGSAAICSCRFFMHAMPTYCPSSHLSERTLPPSAAARAAPRVHVLGCAVPRAHLALPPTSSPYNTAPHRSLRLPLSPRRALATLPSLPTPAAIPSLHACALTLAHGFFAIVSSRLLSVSISLDRPFLRVCLC